MTVDKIQVTENEAAECVKIVYNIAKQAFNDGGHVSIIVLDTGTTKDIKDWYIKFMGGK
jgi:hypothetical protein